MPSLQPYIGAKRLFCAPACQNLETHIRAKGLSSPTMHAKPSTGQNACFALPHVKLETQIRAKGLSSPTMPSRSLQPYIGAKRLFCAPACQT